MDPATWSSKQWIAASVVAGAALSALVVVRQSLAEATRKAQLAPAAPVRRVPKRAPQKHTLGQVALPKSAHFPDPSGTERDYSVFATPEELDSLRQSPPALDYPLTNDQLQKLEDDGFLVIKGLVKGDLCDKMLAEIDSRAEKLFKTNSRDLDADSSMSVFLDIWHNQAYYEIRQLPELYSIFCQLLHRSDLTAALDRVCFLPQDRRDWTPEIEDVEMFCDSNYWYPASGPRYQCMISVTDQATETVQIVPGVHKLDEVRQYREKYQSGEFGEAATIPAALSHRSPHHYRDLDSQAELSVRLNLGKGDVLIWNSRLPYALLPARGGRSGRAGLLCFASYRPASGANDDVDFRRNITRCLMTVTIPSWYGSGLTCQRAPNEMAEAVAELPPAKVDSLGMKLFGLTAWPQK